jgi:orotidine-5'-phosphate decarboxylase
MSSPIILAVDTRDFETAQRWVEATCESVGLYKLGLEFFLTFGADGVSKPQLSLLSTLASLLFMHQVVVPWSEQQ